MHAPFDDLQRKRVEDAARFAYTQLDVTDGAAVKDFAAKHEKVDVLVNCAGATIRTPFDELTTTT